MKLYKILCYSQDLLTFYVQVSKTLGKSYGDSPTGNTKSTGTNGARFETHHRNRYPNEPREV